ncbi:intermembrane phospholipid transport protein YdbH family protein [Caulobacter soli]|uniref:intermembrane phospholipid transport protein YdbH family protein n=1 Tax=Caulobacter soli TaxID=2708539 RepID=UPI0013E9DA84|nr:YdbH domain-containing protein [Caulobacter soli]
MAEPPTPETKPEAPQARARRAALLDAGLEAMSLAALAFVAIGFSAYAGRREISRELALAWLNDKGIEATLELDDLDATGFAGAIRLGPQNAPVFSAERIEVAYDLASPWTGGKFALNTRAVRLVRPRINARLDANGLNFGSLQPLIDDVLKSPAEPTAPGPAILIEDARVLLRTPGGPARLTGDASLDDGQLLRFDGRLGAMRYATQDLSFETEGALIKARKRGDRLTLDVQLALKALSAGQLDLTEAQGSLQADLTYPDLKKLSMVGPAEARLAIKARGAEVEAASLGGLEANLNVAGLLSGDLKRGGLTGKTTLHARGERLTAQGLDSRDVVADLDLSNLALTYDPGGVRGSARTRLAANADRAVAGGAALSRTALEVQSSSLTLVSDKARTSVSGPLSVAAGSGRAAMGGVVLSSLAADAKGRFSAGTDGIALALDAHADADGAMTGLDAQRVTAALPNPDYAQAAARALSRFELSAPALKLGTTDGQTTLSLPRPLALTAAGGARVTLSAPGGPLLAARDGAAHGAAAVVLGGGELPDITLKAPNWRSDASGLASDVVVAGSLDVPPFIGVAGTLAGRAQLAGGGLTIRLNRCTPMTAKAIAMGEPPISDVTFALCPTAQPLVVAANGIWRASVLIQDGAALVNVAQARLEGVNASFVGGGRGFDVAQVKVTSGRVVEASTEGKRFETIGATGEVDLARGQWIGALDGKTLDGHPLGRVTIRHDVASGRGQADIDASKLVFAKGGLQPLGLTPLAAVARDAEGPAAFTGSFHWAGEVMTSEGRASTPGLDFKSPLGQVHRLKGQIVFDSLAPLTAPPGQVLTIDSVDAIVPIQAVQASFGLGAEALHLETTTFEASKGKITIEPFDVPLDGKGVMKGVVNIAGLDLGQLVAGSSLADKIKMEAIVDGRLPFEASAAGFRFVDGKVYATGPGRLSIAREALGQVDAGQGAVDPNDPLTVKKDVPVNAIQDFAYQAMENLHFETLEAGVSSTDQGRLGVLFHIKGEHDPKVAEKAKIGLMELLNGSAFQRRIPLPAKTPVDLTLDTSLNFDELLAAAQRAWADAQARAASSPSVASPTVPPPAPRSDAVQP